MNPTGRLGDMYTPRTIFIIGWAYFALTTILVGLTSLYPQRDLSTSTTAVALLSTARAVQGIGPALLVPNAIALLGRTLPPGPQRNAAFACFGAAGPAGAAIGAVLAAGFAQRGHWAWSCWLLAGVCVAIGLLATVVVPKEQGQDQEREKQQKEFDYAGCITGVTGLLLVNFALNQAPLDGWKCWYIYTSLVLGAVFLAIFLIIERRVDHPLVPVSGLDYRTGFALGCIAAGWSSHGIWAYYLYLFVSFIQLPIGSKL
jgi:MFS family permease